MRNVNKIKGTYFTPSDGDIWVTNIIRRKVSSILSNNT